MYYMHVRCRDFGGELAKMDSGEDRVLSTDASSRAVVKKRKKNRQFKGRKERLRARNEALLVQLKANKDTEDTLLMKERKILKENDLLKR